MTGRRMLFLNNHDIPVFLCIFLIAFSGGCQRHAVPGSHFHDHHVLSFLPVREYSQVNGPLTLVLLDYHHNAASGLRSSIVNHNMDTCDNGVNSNNWTGKLISAGAVDTVFWVSGRELECSDIEARQALLLSSLDSESQEIRDKITGAYHVIDWAALPSLLDSVSSRQLVMSLDLGILTTDPDGNPDEFLYEILYFMEKLNPPLVTVALSAVCQPDARNAWGWFEKTYLSVASWSNPFLESGDDDLLLESNEEYEGRECRSCESKFPISFARGHQLWHHASAGVRTAFLHCLPSAGDVYTRPFVNLLKKTASDYTMLEKEYDDETLKRYVAKIRTVLNATSVDDKYAYKQSAQFFIKDIQRGIAIRFIKGKQDRGCFAFFRELADPFAAIPYMTVQAAYSDPRYDPVMDEEKEYLDIEVSVFGEFIQMDDPFAFIPGIDSLLLETSDIRNPFLPSQDGRTLLQASIAVESGMSAYQFLEAITRKAGFGPGEWQKNDIVFYRAPTLSVRSPVRKDK